MQVSSIPTKMPTVFASGAGGSYIRTVPIPSQIGITAGAASYTDGFPPVTFQSGGAPSGLDVNGLLNQITAWSRWQQAGAPIYYDATFSAAIGGYPRGAVLSQVAVVGGFWISTTDSNTSNPDASGANWLSFPTVQTVPATTFYVNASTGNDTFTGPIWGTTTGTAFATMQACINYVSTFQSSAQVTINVAAGTYGQTYITKSNISSWNIVGAGYTTTFVTSIATGGRAFQATLGAYVNIGGITFSAYYECLTANNGAVIYLSNTLPCAFVGIGATSVAIASYTGSLVTVFTNLTTYFSGTFNSIISASQSGGVALGYHDAVTSYTATLSFGTTTCNNVVSSITGALVQFAVGYVSFVGSTPTGARYYCSSGGGISSGGGGISYIPGTIAGAAASSTSITTANGINAGYYYS